MAVKNYYNEIINFILLKRDVFISKMKVYIGFSFCVYFVCFFPAILSISKNLFKRDTVGSLWDPKLPVDAPDLTNF